MKRTLVQWICCPECRGALSPAVAEQAGDEITSGTLDCARCGRYPIRGGIPRLLISQRLTGAAGLEPVQARTRRSFGFQWTKFAGMHDVFQANFLNYVAPLGPSDFRGRLVLDAGCGFGRHLYYAAAFGAEVIGLDFSDAIESSQRNAGHLPNVHLVQGDIYHPPFRNDTFDLAYSIGVLHHLPDPERGFQGVVRLVKPGGTAAIWVYSTARKGLNACLEMVRSVTTRLPLRVLYWLSWVAGVVDWAGFILPYKALRAWVPTRGWVERAAWPRIKLYAQYPLDVAAADWFDRLAAPLRFYYGPDDLQGWAAHGALEQVQIGSTGAYGWRLCGRRPAASARPQLEGVR